VPSCDAGEVPRRSTSSLGAAILMSPPLVTRVVAWVFGATLLPFVVVSSYLYYSRTHNYWAEPFGDFGALLAALVVGAGCVYLLARDLGWFGRKAWPNVLMIVAYVVVAGPLLSIYSLGYVCSKFGACL
jgi:uncharacterized membrane protein YedE/YeeE